LPDFFTGAEKSRLGTGANNPLPDAIVREALVLRLRLRVGGAARSSAQDHEALLVGRKGRRPVACRETHVTDLYEAHAHAAQPAGIAAIDRGDIERRDKGCAPAEDQLAQNKRRL
jgi:hypothetical protein